MCPIRDASRPHETTSPCHLSPVAATVGRMDRASVKYTAEDLDRMTPAERQAAHEQCMIRDLDDVPADYQPRIDDIRRRLAERLAGEEQHRSAS